MTLETLQLFSQKPMTISPSIANNTYIARALSDLTFKLCNPISRAILFELTYVFPFSLFYFIMFWRTKYRCRFFSFMNSLPLFNIFMFFCFIAISMCFPFSSRPPISVIYTIYLTLKSRIYIRLNKLQLKKRVL